MFDPNSEAVIEQAQHLFTATVQVGIVATSKMEAAAKLRLMAVTSATPIREFEISDFILQE